ncbi:MAG TPA: sensor histidine kinase [Solibacterales bacterium]|nr:sensor histidine kinase [Bryobacterales bacterium]
MAGFWTFFGLFMTVHSVAVRNQVGKPMPWGMALLMDMSYAAFWALVTPAILWMARRFPIYAGARVRNICAHLGATLVLSVVQRGAWELVMFAVYSGGKVFEPAKLFSSIIYGLDYGFLFYWLVLLAAQAAQLYFQYVEGRDRAAQLETQLVQSQLKALRAQLHPHFLFNTLHTISALVQEDPEASERMIARLSEFLRLSLENAGAHEVPLRRELEFLERYLEIERVRFADRLLVEFDIDPGTLDAAVPNLILQPIVENAIRHGIGRSARPGKVAIRSRRDNGSLLMLVEDNGWGLPDVGPIREGVGLSNTRARLKGLYGPGHGLELRNSTGGGLEAEIRIPYHSVPA